MKHLLDTVLSKARKHAEEVEVFWAEQRSTPMGFENNRLKHLETKEGTGIALRIIRNGRIGFSATTNMDDVDGLVSRAVEVSQFGDVARFHMPAFASFPEVPVYDPSVEAVSLESMAEQGQAMIDLARAGTPDLLCDASIVKSFSSIELANSAGGHTRYQKSVYWVSLQCNLIRGTDMLFVGDDLSSCRPVNDTKPVTDTTLRQLELAKTIVPAPTGKVPVVFTPHGVISALLMPLTVAFNGKTVLQGASPLVGKIEKKLFDGYLSIWDDPTLPYVPGSRACDDEGIPSQPMALIEDGVVKSFLYDLQTAGMANAKTTGSANRSMGTLPAPSPSVLLIKEGYTALESIIADIQEGLLVEELLGAGQGNVLNGDFSGNVLLGYKIEKGHIVGRVKDTMIAGNVYEVLKDGIGISRESRWVGGTVRTPSICCQGISVSTKA